MYSIYEPTRQSDFQASNVKFQEQMRKEISGGTKARKHVRREIKRRVKLPTKQNEKWREESKPGKEKKASKVAILIRSFLFFSSSFLSLPSLSLFLIPSTRNLPGRERTNFIP